MPVSSMILKVQEGAADEVSTRLRAMPGVEVEAGPDGQLVVVTDTPDRDEDKRLGIAIDAVPGVMSQTLIYHNFEDVEEESPWVAV
jgi:nitrate reductase NapD